VGRAPWAPSLLACSALASAACSLLLPFHDLDDGSGADAGQGQDTGPGSDGAPSPDSASAHDAGAESAREGLVDGSGDASVDAPVEDTGTGPRYPDGSWCATQPPGMAFCDDFDFETTQFERWTRYEFDIGGSAGFSSTAESPPHAFELKAPALTANTFYIEALEQVVAPASASTGLVLSFSFRPALPWDAGGGGDLSIVSLTQGPGVPRYAVDVTVGQSGTALQEQDTALDGGSSFPAAQSSSLVLDGGHWTHVVVALDLSSSTATLSFDGVQNASIHLQGAWSTSASTTVFLGDWFIPQTSGFDILYDDVVIRQP
jgi:hypothetical protein